VAEVLSTRKRDDSITLTRARVRISPRRLYTLGVTACTIAAGAFALVQLRAWPPHEDETLALFLGRGSLGSLLGTVLGKRGGAPLHFVLAWSVVHLGGGLHALRLASAMFAAASVPVIAALGSRLADRATGFVAAALCSASWVFLFDSVYGRMYSLFLFTSALSYLALVVAVERGGRWGWAAWVAAILACVATHPYGALVLGSQALFMLLSRRRLRESLVALAAVAVIGIPFWRSDLVLAGRFDVGVGGGGRKLGAPGPVLSYLRAATGDLSAGYVTAYVVVAMLAVAGSVLLARRRPQSALLALCVFAVPTIAFLGATLGSSTSPESRHLAFVGPFMSILVGVPVAELSRRRRALAPIAAAIAAGLVATEIAWAWHKTPLLFTGESSRIVDARAAAEGWLAETGRSDDLLFGYESLYRGAWERNRSLHQRVVPRADYRLAADALRAAPKPLGRGVWIFDASDTNNEVQRDRIKLVLPKPAAQFEARVFGPFLVIRTRGPTNTPFGYLDAAERVQLVGKRLYMGDADVNIVTVRLAVRRLVRLGYEPPPAASSRSTTSR
jgi:Dolichyl-phosphate-mannose-protein mannosyltransferase